MNMKYKEKEKEDIDRMLEVGIIEPLEELEWIKTIVVQ
jgi:hypothetical protein